MDQYAPSPPPKAGPSGPDSPNGNVTGGAPTGSFSSGSPSASGASHIDVLDVGGGSSSGVGEGGGGLGGSAAGPGTAADGASHGAGNATELAEAGPLSVAANRPAAALGARAPSGGLGTLPLLLGAAVILTGIAVVAHRGATRAGRGT